MKTIKLSGKKVTVPIMPMDEIENTVNKPVQIQHQHQDMVRSLVKDPVEILKSLTPEKVDLIHMGMGIATEALELLDAIKAHTIYNKPLDLDNVLEEHGDSEFYWEGLRKRLAITRIQALQHNLTKLAERYKKYQYSDKSALERKDKKEAGETKKSSS